jgi:hypothetical protein
MVDGPLLGSLGGSGRPGSLRPATATDSLPGPWRGRTPAGDM